MVILNSSNTTETSHTYKIYVRFFYYIQKTNFRAIKGY